MKNKMLQRFYFVNMFDCYFIHVFKLIQIHDLKLLFHELVTDRGFHIFRDTVNRLVYNPSIEPIAGSRLLTVANN